MTHTYSNLKKKVGYLDREASAKKVAESLPLIHVVSCPNVSKDDLTKSVLNETLKKIETIIDTGSLSPSKDGTSAKNVLEKEGAVYFFWGHAYPLEKKDGLGAQVAFLVNYDDILFPSAKGVPFDTGGILKERKILDGGGGMCCPISPYGRCVRHQECQKTTYCSNLSPECQRAREEIIAAHTAYNNSLQKRYEIREYFELYITAHFDGKAGPYLEIKGGANPLIDKFDPRDAKFAEEKVDERSHAFEIRSLEKVNLKNLSIMIYGQLRDCMLEEVPGPFPQIQSCFKEIILTPEATEDIQGALRKYVKTTLPNELLV